MNKKLAAVLLVALVVIAGAFALLRGGDDEGSAKIAKPSSLTSTAPTLVGKPSIAAAPGGAEGTSGHEAAEGASGTEEG